MVLQPLLRSKTMHAVAPFAAKHDPGAKDFRFVAMFTQDNREFVFAKSQKPFLKDKTIIITGASRGIGRTLALRAAMDGANVVVVAKTTTPNPKLPGTIFSVAEEIERSGGIALPIPCDIRFEDQIDQAVKKAVERFGKIDVLVNNASAIVLSKTDHLSMKQYDLMHQINVRGTFAFSKAVIPYMEKSENPHILNMSPPISMKPEWFEEHVAYTMSKYGMSMSALGLAAELREKGIAVNTLWPQTIIFTAALQAIDRSMGNGVDLMKAQSRRPDVVADAAYVIMCQPSREYTGNSCIDEHVLKYQGVRNFDVYAMTKGSESLVPDGYIDEGYVTPRTVKQILAIDSKL